MSSAALLVLLLPFGMFAGVGVVMFVSWRRKQQGKPPRTIPMIGGILALAFGAAFALELLSSSPEQAARAEVSAEALFVALARDDLDGARRLLTPELAATVDLSEWRISPDTRVELSGRDSATDAIQLFYWLEHEPADRQNVYLGFEERDGEMRVSSIRRLYHLPREVLALGEQLIAVLSAGREVSGTEAYADLDEEDVRRLAQRLRVGGAGARARVVSFHEPALRHVGRVRPPPRMSVRWQIDTAGQTVQLTLHAERRERWRATGLDLHDGT